MKSRIVPSIGLLIGVLMLPTGCASDDGGSEGGSGGSGDAVGGSGDAVGGSGDAVGGSGDAVGGGTADYWSAAYNPAGAPVPAESVYHANESPAPCMPCHNASGVAVTKLAFGGTIFRADGVTPAASVEIGVKDGASQYFVYSSGRGLYWAAGSDNVNWPAADIRMRNSTGEVPKTAVTERGADCDSCHFGAELLTIAP